MRYDTIIFDLDGTILNTLEDLTNSLNVCLTRFNMQTRTSQEVRGFVGNGIRRLIERAAPEFTEQELIQKLYESFIEYYQRHCADCTVPYDGIVNLLLGLKDAGCLLAVVSNKADQAVRELCDFYFKGTFDYCVGEKSGVKRKPAPDSVLEAIRRLGALAERTVYIGDSNIDILTARNAGVDCISVDWGFCDAAFLKEQGATRLVSQPEEIMNICLNG